MAVLNNIYLFVEKEAISAGVTIPTHPVEDGIDITDSVNKKAEKLTLSGYINGDDADNIINIINEWMRSGTHTQYIGRRAFKSALISDFKYDATYKTDKGYVYSLDITEVRYAGQKLAPSERGSQPTKQPTDKGKQQAEIDALLQKAIQNEEALFCEVKAGETGLTIAENAYVALDLIQDNAPLTGEQIQQYIVDAAASKRGENVIANIPSTKNADMVFPAGTFQYIGKVQPHRSNYTVR